MLVSSRTPAPPLAYPVTLASLLLFHDSQCLGSLQSQATVSSIIRSSDAISRGNCSRLTSKRAIFYSQRAGRVSFKGDRKHPRRLATALTLRRAREMQFQLLLARPIPARRKPGTRRWFMRGYFAATVNASLDFTSRAVVDRFVRAVWLAESRVSSDSPNRIDRSSSFSLVQWVPWFLRIVVFKGMELGASCAE